MKKCRLVLTIFCILLLFAGCGSDETSEYITTVQNGYLGEYTDITVKELLSGHYGVLYEREIWDGGPTDSGKEIVEVKFQDKDKNFDDVTIQFTMLGKDCFKVTAYIDELEELDKPTDLLAVLNGIYFEQYILQNPSITDDYEEELEFIRRLDGISGSVVRFGASNTYTGNRARICELDGEQPLELSVPWLLDACGKLDMSYYFGALNDIPDTPSEVSESQYVSIVQNGSLGKFAEFTVKELLEVWYGNVYDDEIWSGGTSDFGNEIVEVRFQNDDDPDAVVVQFTMLNEQCFKITSFADSRQPMADSTELLVFLNCLYILQYGEEHPEVTMEDAEFAQFVQRMDEVSGSAVLYGAAAGYTGDREQICALNHETLLDESAAELLDTHGIIDLADYRMDSQGEPEPETNLALENPLAQYYGYYNLITKDGSAHALLDEGTNPNSFYLYIVGGYFDDYDNYYIYDVHTDGVIPNEESIIFYANDMEGRENVIHEQDNIAGTVTLTIASDNELYLYYMTRDGEVLIDYDILSESDLY